MRVLVLGGTRFIGRFVVDHLVNAGAEVAVFHRGDTEPTDLAAVAHLHGDRRQMEDHRNEFAKLAPEVIIDMLPMNATDARTVQRTLSGVAGRIVAVSSQDVYRAYAVLRRQEPGPLQTLPITEGAALRSNLYPYRDEFAAGHPLHDYDKIPMEQAYLSSETLPATILRLPAVYGPHDPQHRTRFYLRRMLDGRPSIVLGRSLARWRWTRGFVGNIAAAIALAATDDRAAGEVFNLGEIEARTEKEWVQAIATAAGWDGDIRVIPDRALPDHLHNDSNLSQSLVADTRRMRHHLGFAEPVDPDRGLAATVAWEGEQHTPPTRSIRDEYAAEMAALG
jgi:nucleoside-diphosphate-sugar epimerase